ncbi:MAG: type I restriction enzyme HsdR N-terminal domain-containing protein [Peptostreptococcus porci]|uniref:Type I restriction enzyme HsdR N-terminal domain-containing protein n=1 Tax=Peptostreptococcus porci TaxID=2652282 RepID=A0A6N7X222_9FIRM|nr:type I restriction enzyme HsdR N-terminal domain-containing protein [Peptostreptococcus porci]MDD7182989.1 type I restriction enzyme HsdR N-terminal domain-containing protein [Peptostreptococcus porci]MDY2794512.1 type I restriction enzyme HsdR N-terminal domain-containing protein [Peptostreptococcus porci]MDY5480397.1 type I restriction enzyme HsdR N-terminal domain-containing protein [Peptostreptococcus porci]MDY5964453.1 type I restriction enzyme HsdR N-terminal domain-containing protein 
MSKELVKDRVIEYLIDELGVPENMIEVDTPLSEYEEGVEGTIDITVVTEDDNGFLLPLMVVQCIDDDIELTESVVEAQMDFLELVDDTTQVGRIILTNGDQMMYADWNGTELEDEEALPNYKTLIEEYKELEREFLEHEHEHEN